MKKTIGIYGYTGFIGNGLCERFLKDGYNITKVKRQKNNGYMDILINCCGNSNKYYAENHPIVDFNSTVVTTYDSILNNDFKKYVYISSIHAIDKYKSVYGFHKTISEDLIKKYCNDYFVLYCCSVIDKGMNKGIVNDILNDKYIYSTHDSRYQFVDIDTIYDSIKRLIEIKENRSYTLVSRDSIQVSDIGRLLNKEIKYQNNSLLKKHCDVNYTSSLGTKTNEFYIKKLLEKLSNV